MNTHTEKSEFFCRMWLLIIDKVILGGIVFGTAFFIKTIYEENAKTREIIIEFSRVNANLVQTEYSDLIKNTGIVLGIMEDSKPYGMFREGSSSKKQFLSSVKNIDKSILTISGLYPNFGQQTNNLSEQLQKVYAEMTRKREKEEIERDIASIQNLYKDMLDKIRDISIQAVKDDINTVNKHYEKSWYHLLFPK